jgi:hypothetical protein
MANKNIIGPKCLPSLEWRREQTWGGIGRRPHRWAVTSKATPDRDLDRNLDRGLQRGRGGLDAEEQPPPRAQRQVLFSGTAGCGSRSGNMWRWRVLISVATASSRGAGGGGYWLVPLQGAAVGREQEAVAGVRATAWRGEREEREGLGCGKRGRGGASVQANVVFPFFT